MRRRLPLAVTAVGTACVVAGIALVCLKTGPTVTTPTLSGHVLAVVGTISVLAALLRLGRRLGMRRLLPLAVVAVGATCLAGGALAYFTAGSTTGSAGAASAGSLSAGSTPTLALIVRDVQVSWTQNSPSFLAGPLGANANGGYVVSRYADSGGGAISPDASCSGLQQGSSDPLSCTEAGVPTGRWTYTVTPKFYNWVGAESAKSTHVIIPPAAPSSVSLVNGGGVGSAYINPTNQSSLSVDVALPSTSLASDTVTLTLSDGTNTVTPPTQPGTAGAGTLHFTGIDVSGLADGTITLTAQATSSYGDNSANTSSNVTKDTVAPTVIIIPKRGTDWNGWYNQPVTFSASTSIDPAPGSGIQSCDPDVTYSGPDTSTGSLTFHCTDNAGNTGSNSVLFKYDATAPAGVMSLKSANHAYFASDRLYFNPNAAGSFTFIDTVTDTTSGPASATFAALSASGWTHAGETVSTPAGGPYTSSTYSWTAGAATPTSKTTTSTDNAGNTATETFSFVGDSAAPTGGALTVNGTVATSGGSSSTTTSTSFSIGSRTDYTETLSSTQSGLSSSVLTIQSETLSGSTCGAPGSGGPYTTATTISGTTNPSITTGYCYRYVLTGTDRVGNSASISTTVAVPVTPATATEIASVATKDTNAPYTAASGSFTPSSGAVYLVFVGHISSTGDSASLAVTGSLSIANSGNPITSVANGITYGWAWEVTGTGTSSSTITATFANPDSTGGNSDVMQVIEISGPGAPPFVGTGTTTSGFTSNGQATVNLSSPASTDSEAAFLYVDGATGGNDPGWATPGISTISGTYQNAAGATGFGCLVAYADPAVSAATTTAGKFPGAGGYAYVGIAFELTHP